MYEQALCHGGEMTSDPVPEHLEQGAPENPMRRGVGRWGPQATWLLEKSQARFALICIFT